MWQLTWLKLVSSCFTEATHCTEAVYREKFHLCNTTAYSKWPELIDQKSKCCLAREAAECYLFALDDIDCDHQDSKTIRRDMFNRYRHVHLDQCHDYQDINGCYTPFLGIVFLYFLLAATVLATIIYTYMYFKPKPKITPKNQINH